ncbi:MAG: hypothetical protein P8J32_03430 [bacterium]|nr:hypothetical protein [bacterium]
MDVIRDKEAKATMLHIKDGAAMYQVNVEGKPYMFPIPLVEMATGTFMLEDKVRIFQRWIRKAIDDNKFDKMF